MAAGLAVFGAGSPARAGGRAPPVPGRAPVQPVAPPARGRPATVVREPVRGGQQINADGDLIVMATGQRRGRARRRRQHPRLRRAARPGVRRHRGRRGRHGVLRPARGRAAVGGRRAPGRRGDRPQALASTCPRRAGARAAGDPHAALSPRVAGGCSAREEEIELAKVIVVTSGKGGVGKTTSAAALATGLALHGQEDRGDRLRRRPAQPRPDHGLRAPGRVRLHQRDQRRHPPAARR